MNRKNFLKTLALLPVAGKAMKLQELHQLTGTLNSTATMPVLFIGHGSPMNAIEDNEYVRVWHEMALQIPRPQAILCISAHWETKGTFVTAMKNPETIHDFGGFPQKLFDAQYAASGDPELAADVQRTVKKTTVGLNQDWGLDHGCWVPLIKMYPEANIPVIQLSLDYTQGAQYHYDLAKELAPLRNKGVLIMSSGNMVHNLRMIQFPSDGNFNKEFGFDWALEMQQVFRQKITDQDHKALIDYNNLTKSARLGIPTTEHYFPLLYTMGLQGKKEKTTFYNDKAVAGSLTMTSVLVESV